MEIENSNSADSQNLTTGHSFIKMDTGAQEGSIQYHLYGKS